MNKKTASPALARPQTRSMTTQQLRDVHGGENLEFEMVSGQIQKLTQMQQALSNVLQTQHELAMNAIRHIKG